MVIVGSAVMTFLPLSAVVLSNIVLNEPLHGLHLAAGAFVTGGIVLTAVKPAAMKPAGENGRGTVLH